MTVPAGQAAAYTITGDEQPDTDTASFTPKDYDLPGGQRRAVDGRSGPHGVPVADGARGLDLQPAGGGRQRSRAVHEPVAAGWAPAPRSRSPSPG